MPRVLGSQGGAQKIILYTKPFYLSIRTPLIGKRRWNLRVRIFANKLPRFVLGKLPKCWACGAVVTKCDWESCPDCGHSGEFNWWRRAG